MSFKCYGCAKTKQHGEMVVLQTRPVTYVKRLPNNREVVVGQGYETVHEERVCSDCMVEVREAMAEAGEGVLQ